MIPNDNTITHWIPSIEGRPWLYLRQYYVRTANGFTPMGWEYIKWDHQWARKPDWLAEGLEPRPIEELRPIRIPDPQPFTLWLPLNLSDPSITHWLPHWSSDRRPWLYLRRYGDGWEYLDTRGDWIWVPPVWLEDGAPRPIEELRPERNQQRHYQ